MEGIVGLFTMPAITFECVVCGGGMVFIGGKLMCMQCGAEYEVIGFAG